MRYIYVVTFGKLMETGRVHSGYESKRKAYRIKDELVATGTKADKVFADVTKTALISKKFERSDFVPKNSGRSARNKTRK